MAPTHSSRRRPFNTRGRRSVPRATSSEAPVAVEPPQKKRRYIPGGPGGGGRYVEDDGTLVPVGGTGPGGYNYTGPRGRVGRENAANGIQPIVYDRPRRESRRERPERPERTAMTPRFSSAAQAAAAKQGDGFKPREERSWEEFHPDLDVEMKFPVFAAEEVDGLVTTTDTSGHKADMQSAIPADGEILPIYATNNITLDHSASRSNGDGVTPLKERPTPDRMTSADPDDMSPKRRPGRPSRRQDSMLKGIGTPEAPRMIPLPGPNPREKLTLPKPSFRLVDPFVTYEKNTPGQINYVDRTMANVGYQESDIYIRPEKHLIRMMEGTIEEDLDVGPGVKSDGDSNAAIGSAGVGTVEYDMDEQDEKWLEAYNMQRKAEQIEPIKPAVFEITMTKIEKEWHALEKRIPKPNPKPPQTHRPRSSSAAAVNGEPSGPGEEQDSKCAICDDGDCENTNAIVFCDGCDLAVHQECYGVPFIPEGQWLCRRCQLIGRGTPTCIFCPNTDGAFKQTNGSKWAHLLCAIWIPEVSLGNTTFMEPVMDVEKVPDSRRRLTCYICRQKMGACIQCSNKNCFVAFHPTCARRAKLFLQMKSAHAGPATLDPSLLKAYCTKHVPQDWRSEHDVDAATIDAMEYYRYTMRGKIWANSRQAASAMTPVLAHELIEQPQEESHPKVNLIIGGNKRKRIQTQRMIWRLPSGAPVIPQVVFDSVENSLQRFTMRKRRDYAAEACKYWTLKREARRGAALLKRLQLQMETFSSMEITRRNFAGMGAAGRVRLGRRITFAEQLLLDMEKLRGLCASIKEREHEKLQDAYILRDIVDMVYFPIVPLLWPILEKAQALDNKNVFGDGFNRVQDKLAERFYTSVSSFSAEFGAVLSTSLEVPVSVEQAEAADQIVEEGLTKELTAEYKSKRQLARRIIKAIQGPLEDAMRKESEACRKPFEKELRDLDLLLASSIASTQKSLTASAGGDASDEDMDGRRLPDPSKSNPDALANGNTTLDDSPEYAHGPRNDFKDLASAQIQQDLMTAEPDVRLEHAGDDLSNAQYINHQSTPEGLSSFPVAQDTVLGESRSNGNHIASSVLPKSKEVQGVKPPTPPLGSGELQTPLSGGGVPWYMEPFDPEGTTIAEERWTGREVVRGMSEELSDMDEEELSGLVDADMTDGAHETYDGALHPTSASVAYSDRRKNGAKRRRWRGYR